MGHLSMEVSRLFPRGLIPPQYRAPLPGMRQNRSRCFAHLFWVEHEQSRHVQEHTLRNVPTNPRAARYELERVRDLLSHLELAKVALRGVGYETTAIDTLIAEARVHAERLASAAGGRIDSRRRVKRPARPGHARVSEYYLFLDECGNHVPGYIDPKFPAFCLSGIIVSREAYEAFDVVWKAWKTRYLGAPDQLTHEPDVRTCSGKFHRADPYAQEDLLLALESVLRDLEFRIIAAVVDLEAFEGLYPDSAVDEFLPQSSYLMCIDFVMERFVHFLQHEGRDGKGLVVAESRGLKEDAIVHAEFIRLHLQGTQFVSQSDFRRQLRPHIEFYRKSRNSSGLEVADLTARPLAEIVLDPEGDPARWNVFRDKLYDGGKDEPHKYGLKVYPLTEANDPFPELPRKAKGDA